MKRLNQEESKEYEDFEERLANAMAYGTADDVRKILKEGFEIDLEHLMKMTMWHCNDLEDVKILKEQGYDFKDDQKAVEEFAKHGTLKPEILQFMIDNGAVISWKAIKLCANRYDLETLRIMVSSKKEFFPID